MPPWTHSRTGRTVDINIGVSLSQPRRAVGAAVRFTDEVPIKHGYGRDSILQRYLETDGELTDIVLLA